MNNFSWTRVLLQVRSMHFVPYSSRVVWGFTLLGYSSKSRLENVQPLGFLFIWTTVRLMLPRELTGANSWSAVPWHPLCTCPSLSPTLVNIWRCLSGNTNKNSSNKNLCVCHASRWTHTIVQMGTDQPHFKNTWSSPFKSQSIRRPQEGWEPGPLRVTCAQIIRCECKISDAIQTLFLKPLFVL